ncbi:uncharacterized protein [Aristolochia californica]|uniref:uncharacterized protein n=1 Tax=Aristolochia californica TaxID=171875 RepID=UPI0035DE68BA
MLRNLMEEKQLDFNAPLLSVRRFASSANSDKTDGDKVVKFPPRRSSLPFHKPELKSGPIRDAGSVPFLWEQIPGRPKASGRPPPDSFDAPPLTPKLPPGRAVDVTQEPQQQHQEPKKRREQLRQQQQRQSSLQSIENNSLEDPNVRKTIENKNPENHVTAVVRSKQPLQEELKPTSEEDDYDDAFSDALETLSRSESIFMNCSVSGLSALDGPDRKPFGNMSVDPEARDFMMDRFLPAAKAMASEAPQYATRKPASARQPARPMNLVGREKRHVSYPYRPVVVPQQNTEEDEESDSDLVNYDHSGYLSAKGCGLLPRFCLKSSLGLLNPVPEMRMRNRMLLSPAVGKVNTWPKASTSHRYSNEDDEHSWEAVYKYKLVNGLQSHQAQGNRSRPTSESNQLSLSDSQTIGGSSPHRRSAGDAISPYRNDAPQSSFHEGTGFLGIPKQSKKGDSLDIDSGRHSWGIVKFHDTSRQGSGSSSPAIEKTLYVDSVQVLDTPKSLSSSDTKDLQSPTYKDNETVMDSQELEKCSVLAAQLSIDDKKALQPKFCEIGEPKSQLRLSPDADKAECFYDDSQLVTEKVLTRSTHSDDPVDQGNALTTCLQGLLPPPLPKSPSESWLWRTLPSVPSKNPSSGSYLGVQVRSRKQAAKASTADPKWENLVKNSTTLRSQTRFSEELNKSLAEQ